MKKRLFLPLALAIVLTLGVMLGVGVMAAGSDPTLEITGANLVFSERVYILWAIDSENIENKNDIELLIFRGADIKADECIKGKETASVRSNGNTVDEDGVNGLVFEYQDVAAAEMTENIYARAYYTCDGVKYYSPVVKYSILQYAMNKLGYTGTETEDELLRDMLEAMLVYGATAQKYFDVNTDRLATDTYFKISAKGAALSDGTSSGLYKMNSTASFTADYKEGYPFVVWTDESGAVLGTGNTYEALADGNKTVTATLYATDPHVHTFSSSWSFDSEKHWRASTCGHDVRADEAEHFIGADGACVSDCGYKSVVEHEHTYSSDWSSDETSHWHAANCEHRELVSDMEEHSYNENYVCSVCGYATQFDITLDDIEEGGWAYGAKSPNAKRIRVNRLIPLKEGSVINYDLGTLELFIYVVDSEDASSGDRCGWYKGSGKFVLQRDAYVGILFAASGRNDAILPADYNCDITIIPASGDSEMNYDTVNVYKFGGEGNDWCFVYFPDGYDPDRREPYPFVILNHGNGWFMDGSVQKANYTNIGQYMSPDEIAKQPANLQSRYIPTEDKSLWYSNPTIEALLAAGYVVAGAQNYGDGLYGNENCANACVDFFNHMVETYNVETSCYMIGASNGAMTTLNAAAKLGNKVKSIILQYPLTSIISQYAAGKHQDGIASSYGLDTSKVYTKAELEALISDYDPIYKDVVNGVKQGYFPSVKIYYSMTDTTTPATANALPLIAMLENSGIEYESVQVDSDGVNKQHGHVDHFDPEAFVAWFDAH